MINNVISPDVFVYKIENDICLKTWVLNTRDFFKESIFSVVKVYYQ